MSDFICIIILRLILVTYNLKCKKLMHFPKYDLIFVWPIFINFVSKTLLIYTILFKILSPCAKLATCCNSKKASLYKIFYVLNFKEYDKHFNLIYYIISFIIYCKMLLLVSWLIWRISSISSILSLILIQSK